MSLGGVAISWAALLSASFLALVFSWLVMRLGVEDAPDGGRKDQPRPVPTLGGLAIAGGHLLALGLLLSHAFVHISGIPNVLHIISSDILSTLRWHWLVLPAVALLLLGAWDDISPKPAVVRLIVIALICFGTCLFSLSLEAHYRITPPEWAVFPLIAGGALFMFSLINATNFMDGSNGLAMGSGAIMLCVFFWLMVPQPTYLLAAAIVGFLVFNLTGRLYAGDAGSMYVGFWIAAAGLHGVIGLNFSIWIPPLVTLPFLTDVLMTLIWRARRGENLMQPHRDHAYQLLRRSGWGHLQVAALWWAMTAVCGALAILVERELRWSRPENGFGLEFAVFAAALAVSIALWIIQRRTYWPRVSAPG